jgi:uncharacterized protein (DUF39 family)
VPRDEHGVPKVPAGTLTVIGDLKGMKPEWLVGVSLMGYGTSLAVGIGTAIPILDEALAATAGLSDEELFAPIVEYSDCYPNMKKSPAWGSVSYAQLKKGLIEIEGKKVPTASLSSYPRAVAIAEELKAWVMAGKFLLTEPVAPLPGPESGIKFRPLAVRERRNDDIKLAK